MSIRATRRRMCNRRSVLRLNVNSTLKAGCLSLAFAAFSVAPAHAQMTWTDKGFVNVNVGAQTGSDELAGQSTFELYGENGSLSTTQDVGGGGLFDFSAGYKVWKNLAIGIGYSHSGSDADVAVAASVPDPVFFDRPRGLTAVASGVEHSENVFHIQATWIMPVTDVIDLGFSFGPSFYNVKQQVPTAITVTEPGPTLGQTTITEEKESGVGFNLGMDVNYFFTSRIGAGLLLRYTHASVDIPNTTDSLGVGGFQIGVGARVRF
jgi:hypothetical protein